MARVHAAIRLLATLGLGAAVVAAPVPINFAALVAWALLVAGWVKRRVRAGGDRAGVAELAVQLAAMGVLVLAAAAAPVKVVDRVKARHVTLPQPAMRLGELQEPEVHGLNRPFRYAINSPDAWAGRVVRFPATELTVAEFIRAIERQTPLRHRFGHCGNGSTILWGGDCSFGLLFSVPHP